MEQRLTGRTRWRNKSVWFKTKPVLQVEYECGEYVNYGYFIEYEVRTFWKDATTADYLNCPAILRECNIQQTDI